MTQPKEPKEPDGFICAGCGRPVFTMKLAPFCLRCRANMPRPN